MLSCSPCRIYSLLLTPCMSLLLPAPTNCVSSTLASPFLEPLSLPHSNTSLPLPHQSLSCTPILLSFSSPVAAAIDARIFHESTQSNTALYNRLVPTKKGTSARFKAWCAQYWPSCNLHWAVAAVCFRYVRFAVYLLHPKVHIRARACVCRCAPVCPHSTGKT